jgi:[ribosomal protein S18]-alanine N-acetyltransferase
VPQSKCTVCDYNNAVQYSLRDARRGDFELLWEIDQQCFAPGISYSRFELGSYMRRWGAFTIVAETASSRPERPIEKSAYAKSCKIIGFIVAESRRRVGHIITIDILPEARRHGLGSALLLAAEEKLRQADCGAIVLEAAVDNSSALAFYARHQYREFRKLPKYYPNGVDGLMLRKDLLSSTKPS